MINDNDAGSSAFLIDMVVKKDRAMSTERKLRNIIKSIQTAFGASCNVWSKLAGLWSFTGESVSEFSLSRAF